MASLANLQTLCPPNALLSEPSGLLGLPGPPGPLTSLSPWSPIPSALVGTCVCTLQGVARAWQRSIVQKLTSFYGLLIDRFTTMLLT
jgi:hypothetical protein